MLSIRFTGNQVGTMNAWIDAKEGNKWILCLRRQASMEWCKNRYTDAKLQNRASRNKGQRSRRYTSIG